MDAERQQIPRLLEAIVELDGHPAFPDHPDHLANPERQLLRHQGPGAPARKSCGEGRCGAGGGGDQVPRSESAETALPYDPPIGDGRQAVHQQNWRQGDDQQRQARLVQERSHRPRRERAGRRERQADRAGEPEDGGFLLPGRVLLPPQGIAHAAVRQHVGQQDERHGQRDEAIFRGADQPRQNRQHGELDDQPDGARAGQGERAPRAAGEAGRSARAGAADRLRSRGHGCGLAPCSSRSWA